MIQLATSATTAYAHLASPPTHAILDSVMVIGQMWTGGMQSARFQYRPGSLDSTGAFVPNFDVSPIIVNLPRRHVTDDVTVAAIDASMLGTLLGAGIAPSASDASVSMAVPAKKAGDFQRRDLDTIASQMEPKLAGTVI